MFAWLTTANGFLATLLFIESTNLGGGDCSELSFPRNCPSFTLPNANNYIKQAKRFQTDDSAPCCVDGDKMKDLPKMMSSDGAMLGDYCKKTVPTSESPIVWLNPKDENCTLIWEPFLPAKVEDKHPLPGWNATLDYAAQIGYIERASNETFQGMVKYFLTFVNMEIPGEHRFGVKKWMRENEWAKNISLGHIQYVRVPSAAKMMILCLRCPKHGVFGIAPVEFDEEFASNLNSHNWTDDFKHLEECKNVGELLTENNVPEVREMTFLRQLNGGGHQVGHMGQAGMSWVGFSPIEGTHLTLAQLEAHKYKYGYTKPIRSPDLEASADDYKIVDEKGVLLMPIEEAYKPRIQYAIRAYFRVITWEHIALRGYDVSTAEGKAKWNDQMFKFRVGQEKFACAGFNLTLPRVNGFGTTVKDGRKMFWLNIVERYEVTNMVTLKTQELHHIWGGAPQFYKLWKNKYYLDI